MTRFCNTHIIDRTEEELVERLNELKSRPYLGPGLKKELVRIEERLIEINT